MELDQRQQAIAWTFVIALTCGWTYKINSKALQVTFDLNLPQEMLEQFALDGETPDRIEASVRLEWELRKEPDDDAV